MAAKRKVDKAVILADAETLGDAEAAKRWKVSERSIRRYRSQADKDPGLSGLATEKGKALAVDWLPMAKQVRREALERGRELMKSETDLHKVTGFLKTLNDAVTSDEMLLDGRDSKGAGTEVPAAQGGQVPSGRAAEAGAGRGLRAVG